MNDKFIQAQPHLISKQSRDIWKQARRRITVVAIIGLVLLAISITRHGIRDRNASAIVSTPTPSPPITPRPTPTPKLVSVTYYLVVDSDEWSNLPVDLWYSAGSEQRHQKREQRIFTSTPYLINVQAPPGTFVELFAAIQSNLSGEVTCRIVVAEKVIQENTSQGQGAGVYCEGPAIP